MDAKLIIGNLLIKGNRPVDIAKKLAVSRQAVSQTIHGIIKSPKIRAEISTTIGKPAEEIWPDAA